jgi:hypothetical protein
MHAAAQVLLRLTLMMNAAASEAQAALAKLQNAEVALADDERCRCR